MFIGYSKYEEITFMITIVAVMKKSIMGYELWIAKSNSLSSFCNSISTPPANITIYLYLINMMITVIELVKQLYCKYSS